MNIKLAISPCPNDTFTYYALISNKIDCEGLNFKPIYYDIEELNERCVNLEYDVSKISFATFPMVSSNYNLLSSGGALGNGVGPLLVYNKELNYDKLTNLTVAIPGLNTSANFLLSHFYPQIRNKVNYLFSDIENAVLTSEVDLGLIIHESRFTYKKLGLRKYSDLGSLWEKKYDLPIPLGCVVIKKEINQSTKIKVANLIKKSIKYAFNNVKEVMPFVKRFSRQLSDEVCKKHINLYVNDFSLNYGKTGIKAINTYLNILSKKIKYKIIE